MLVQTGQKWELSTQSFDSLLQAIDSDREIAAEKYLHIRKNLVRYFEGRGFYEADAHADEVFNRIARKTENGETFENVGSYVYGVARLLLLELYKLNSREQKFIQQQPTHFEPSFEDEDESGGKLKCLNSCLNELSEDNRRLIISYYQGEKRNKIENRQRLAEQLAIPQNALRNRAVRLRQKLESCIQACIRREK